MSNNNNSVFISYRRDDSVDWARNIYFDLKNHDFDVFFDIESLKNGRFRERILDEIKARTHFLLLLKPTSLDRCVDQDDWLTLEIEQALKNNRNIIPILYEDFPLQLLEDKLEGRLADLKGINTFPFHQYFFSGVMSKLRNEFLQSTTKNPSITSSNQLELPFKLLNNSMSFTSNFANSAGCNWQGLGGSITDINGQPINGIRIHVYDGHSTAIYS